MGYFSYEGEATRITVVGHTAFDHICKTPYLPPVNASTPVTERAILFGGGAANIATGIARLGQKATLISAVGGDFVGSVYEKRMLELGVQLENYVMSEEHSATAFMFTDDNGDQMTFFEWGASRAFADAKPGHHSFVHMATADPTYNVEVARLAAFSSFDPGQDVRLYTREHLDVLFDHINVLMANRHEYDVMCETLGCTGVDIAVRVPLAIETLGERGSLLRVRGEEIHVPACKVDMADPSGAGDAYRAGFFSGLIQGYDVVVCAQIGAVTASFVVAEVGCQTNQCDWEMMRQRYESNFGLLPDPVRVI